MVARARPQSSRSRAERAELTLAADNKIAEIAAWINDLQAFRAKPDERQGLKVRREGLDWKDLGEASPS